MTVDKYIDAVQTVALVVSMMAQIYAIAVA